MPFTGHNSTLARLFLSKTVLIALGVVAVLAVAGTTVGYAALSTNVTLSLDGEDRQVRTMGDTVGEVLEAEDIEIDEHDIVAPGLDEQSRTAPRSASASAARSSSPSTARPPRTG